MFSFNESRYFPTIPLTIFQICVYVDGLSFLFSNTFKTLRHSILYDQIKDMCLCTYFIC